MNNPDGMSGKGFVGKIRLSVAISFFSMSIFEISQSASENDLDRSSHDSYFLIMKSVGIKDLKNNLSGYLEFVRSGETIIVMDRQTPIAELKQISKSKGLTKAFLEESIANHSMVPAKQRSTIVYPKSLRTIDSVKAKITRSWKDAYLADRE